MIRAANGQIPAFPVYLFDIDGTLLDSATDICGAIQQVLDNNGAGPQDFEYLKSFVGLDMIDLFQEIFPGHTARQLAEMFEQYRSFYRARGHQSTKVFPGAREGLAALGGRKSTATSKGSPGTRAILQQFGLLQYFDHVQGTDGFPSKPAPDVVLTALHALGARPEECLFVGDSTVDLEAGKWAGVKTCAVRYGYGKIDELARLEPDYWIGDLRDLVGTALVP